mgnify:CR=1 FL=1
MANLWLTLGIVTFLFIAWAELTVGNIFLRTDSLGSKSLNWMSLFGFLSHPFRSSLLWTRETLDINYAFVLLTTLILYFALKT